MGDRRVSSNRGARSRASSTSARCGSLVLLPSFFYLVALDRVTAYDLLDSFSNFELRSSLESLRAAIEPPIASTLIASIVSQTADSDNSP